MHSFDHSREWIQAISWEKPIVAEVLDFLEDGHDIRLLSQGGNTIDGGMLLIDDQVDVLPCLFSFLEHLVALAKEGESTRSKDHEDNGSWDVSRTQCPQDAEAAKDEEAHSDYFKEFSGYHHGALVVLQAGN